MYLDNWYNSPDLYIRLSNLSTNTCGTVRLNRKNMPAVPNERRSKGDVSSWSCDEKILFLIWTDKKDVKMLSTMHSAEMRESEKTNREGNKIMKPVCVLDYNRCMGGVDRSDQLRSTCTSVRKYVKWYKKLFLPTRYVRHKFVHNAQGSWWQPNARRVQT